jgi:hypothetical protein
MKELDIHFINSANSEFHESSKIALGGIQSTTERVMENGSWIYGKRFLFLMEVYVSWFVCKNRKIF